MSRAFAPWTLLLVFLAISLAAAGAFLFVVLGGSVSDWDIADDGDVPRAAAQPLRLRNRLQLPVSLPKGVDPNTPLKDALEFLSEEYQIPLVIDTGAFDKIGVQKVEDQPVQLPKMTGVRLATVLRLLLGQIRGDLGWGTYTVEVDYVLLTTTLQASTTDTWTADGEVPAPVIDLQCVQKPLRAALYEVRDSTGINVVIDPRAADKARRPITVSLLKVPADTVVRLLADIGGLRMVALDNVLYVTTVENARELAPVANDRPSARSRGNRGSDVPPGMVPAPVRRTPQWPQP